MIPQRMKIPVGNAIISIDIIEFENRHWLVPLWVVSDDGRSMRPVRIIAPRFAPGYKPPLGPEALEIFVKMPLPASLLERGVIPPEIAQLVEVRENPDISAPNPGAFH